MSFKYSYIIPITCSIWFTITFISTYIISVYRDDVTPILPYISDTGTWTPQSCIFGFMLSIAAVLQAATVYIRYRQISYLHPLPSNIGKQNTASLYLGMISSIGVIIVASFQETNALIVHVIGAVLTFGLGVVFLCLQTIISFQIYPMVGNKIVNYMRAVCCTITIISLILCIILAAVSFQQYTGGDPTKWTRNNPGYEAHVGSAAAEWIMAFFFILYISLYTGEFKKYEFFEPPVMETEPLYM